MKDLIQKIKRSHELSNEAEQYLYSISKERNFAKSEILIREGQSVNKTFFVTDGCLRSYCIDKSGKEHTLQFAINDWWISDFIAIYNNEPATLMVECLKDSKVIEFNTKKLNETFTLFPEFEAFQRNQLERHVVSLHKRILNQLRLSASERYGLFLNEYAEIEQYTRNYHLASYLGITQESLSRIRIERSKK